MWAGLKAPKEILSDPCNGMIPSCVPLRDELRDTHIIFIHDWVSDLLLRVPKGDSIHLDMGVATRNTAVSALSLQNTVLPTCISEDGPLILSIYGELQSQGFLLHPQPHQKSLEFHNQVCTSPYRFSQSVCTSPYRFWEILFTQFKEKKTRHRKNDR